jgi:magnesium-protoporphyrin IX monomethyl ester (oxidative) cyclase
VSQHDFAERHPEGTLVFLLSGAAHSLKMLFAPLGIAYIASVIRNDVDVEILDAVAEDFNREQILDDSFLCYGLSLQDIEGHIRRSRPDIVGVSCLFSSEFPMVREICQLTKNVDDDIITITGGTHHVSA